MRLNPLVFTKQKKFYAANIRVEIDNAAIFRQSEMQTYQDYSQISPIERSAKQMLLNF